VESEQLGGCGWQGPGDRGGLDGEGWGMDRGGRV
jgi:hypothetical protein